MRVPMTERILSSILALQAYRKWLWANKVATFGPHVRRDDSDEAAEWSYFRTIRAAGMPGTKTCFEAAMNFDSEPLLQVEESDLKNFFFTW